MKWIRNDVLSGKIMAGTFLGLGSSIIAEIAGRSGFDWVLVDLEHGCGDHPQLVFQLQALESTPAAPLVRIAWNDPTRFKRVLDLGPSGVMVPYVSTAEEAEYAVKSMRYPPKGIRGMASSTRATTFGQEFSEYFLRANEDLLTIIQIETAQGVKHASEIASIDGVDVLFVGPLDLSVNLGYPRQFDHPEVRSAMEKVISACRNSGKIPGLFLGNQDVGQAIEQGFTFLSHGSDTLAVTGGLKNSASVFDKYRIDE